MIRRIKNEKLKESFEFIRQVYLKTEYQNDKERGYQTFKKEFVENEELYLSFLKEENKMYGFYSDNELKGVISLGKNNYIYFLFVEPRFHHQGIASKLLKYVERIVLRRKNHVITLDSSVYGLDFYMKNGFIKISDCIIEDGMSYIPMQKYLIK